jgi:hypothetical protein
MILLLALLAVVAAVALQRTMPASSSSRPGRAVAAAVRWGGLSAVAGLVVGVVGPRLLLPGSDDAALAGVVVAVPVAALVGAVYGAVASLQRDDSNDA